jgi:hypothetical protein
LPDASGWKTYTNPKWGYTLKYPQTWIELSNYGAPDTEKYFSNQIAPSPMSLDDAGIYLAISVNDRSGDDCLLRSARLTPERQGSLKVDGVSATLNVFTPRGGFALLILNLQRYGYCYWFAYIVRTVQVRDAIVPVAVVMLSQTFKFGQPSAPPTWL